MKKGLLAVLIVLFATAAYAEVSFSISGDMFARGNYFRNQDTVSATNVWANGHSTQKFMDGAVHLYPKIKVDNATINLKVTMHDEIWQNRNGTAGITGGGVTQTNSYAATTNDDSNIAIERAWLTYLFTENTILDVGLMDGSVWGSTFADFLTARYRVKITQKTPVGVFGFVYEKNAEESNPDQANALNNQDDATNYALFAITKAGNVWVKPLLFFVNNTSGVSGAAVPFRSLYGALELNGDLGPISFDSEFGYKSWEFTKPAQQEAATATIPFPFHRFSNGYTWGAYVNVFKALDAAKPGFIATYGSWDKNCGLKNTVNKKNLGWGFSNGNDFKSNLIFGGKGIDSINLVSVPLGNNPATLDYAGNDLTAFTMLKPYVADIKTGVNGLTCSLSGSYMFSNQKDNMWDGAKAYEFDAGIAYKLSNNVTYSIDAGWGRLAFSHWARNNTRVASLNPLVIAGSPNPLEPNPTNPKSIYAIQHMIKLVF